MANPTKLKLNSVYSCAKSCCAAVAFLFNNYFHVCKMQKSLICNLSPSFNVQLCICRAGLACGCICKCLRLSACLYPPPSLTSCSCSCTSAYAIKFSKTFELRRHLRFAVPAVGAASASASASAPASCCQLHSLLNAFQRRG